MPLTTRAVPPPWKSARGPRREGTEEALLSAARPKAAGHAPRDLRSEDETRPTPARRPGPTPAALRRPVSGRVPVLRRPTQVRDAVSHPTPSRPDRRARVCARGPHPRFGTRARGRESPWGHGRSAGGRPDSGARAQRVPGEQVYAVPGAVSRIKPPDPAPNWRPVETGTRPGPRWNAPFTTRGTSRDLFRAETYLGAADGDREQ